MNNILFDTQRQIAELIKTDEYLSSVRVLAENSKDIDYEISEALGQQGIVAVVMTPRANYIGNYEDKCIAWEIDELTVQVVENVTVNRGKKDGVLTGQDVAMRIIDWLSSPKYGRSGMFSPVNYEQGEDGNLLVNKVVFKCMVYDDVKDEEVIEPFYFTSQTDYATVALVSYGSNAPAIQLEISNDGKSWVDYVVGNTITLLASGSRLYFRAKDNNDSLGIDGNNYFSFVLNGTFAADGNIQSLLSKDGDRIDVPTYCYYRLFRNCSELVQAPKLNGLDLSPYCYAGMFQDCSNITELVLPAETLAEQCYRYMCSGCKKLSYINVGFKQWQPANATTNWLNNIASTGKFVCSDKLPILNGNNYIPANWEVIQK